jgi:glycosyltransferase involved in cell wall biosynthesis
MRILYLADIRFPLERANGIQSMQTCHALARRGHVVTLLVRADTQQPPRDPYAFYGLARIDGLTIEIAPVAGPAASRRTGYLTYAIGRAIGHARQDVIFTRDLGLAALLVRLPPALRAPVVYEAHGIAADVAAMLPQLLSTAAAPSPAKLRRLAARDARVWRAADAYVTITRALGAELERRFGSRSRIAVVPDGVGLTGDNSSSAPCPLPTPPPFDPAHSPLPHGFVIGYAGHLYPWKGVDLVIEAVAALPDTCALIVGGHEQEPDIGRVKQIAVQLDCASRVTFTGMIAPPEVAPLLRRADVLVLPNPSSAISREFTSPLKLFEYMASGRPIVASDLPAIREVLTDGENALLVEPGRPQALTAAIRRLQEDPALGRRLAERALRDVREYTWARRAERLEALFQQIAA